MFIYFNRYWFELVIRRISHEAKDGFNEAHVVKRQKLRGHMKLNWFF